MNGYRPIASRSNGTVGCSQRKGDWGFDMYGLWLCSSLCKVRNASSKR